MSGERHRRTRSRSCRTCRASPSLADRLQQGFVNFLYLGRAMIHPSGFSVEPGLPGRRAARVIDTRRLFYAGNSQGGIFGGALTARRARLRPRGAGRAGR